MLWWHDQVYGADIYYLVMIGIAEHDSTKNRLLWKAKVLIHVDSCPNIYQKQMFGTKKIETLLVNIHAQCLESMQFIENLRGITVLIPL
jgi:hypothetical protein